MGGDSQNLQRGRDKFDDRYECDEKAGEGNSSLDSGLSDLFLVFHVTQGVYVVDIHHGEEADSDAQHL